LDDDVVVVILTTVLLCVIFGLDEVGERCLNVLYREGSVWVRPKTGTDNSGDGNGGFLR